MSFRMLRAPPSKPHTDGKGVLNEDDYLCGNPLQPTHRRPVAQIREELAELIDIIYHQGCEGYETLPTKIRNHVKEDIEIKKKIKMLI